MTTSLRTPGTDDRAPSGIGTPRSDIAPMFGTLRHGWLVSAIATLILLGLRAPQTFLHPQLWAEDGGVFFREQILFGVRALGVPYAGYLHLAPRLSALFSAPFGAVPVPALYAGFSVALALWSAATIGAARLPFAWVLGATLILPPHTGEVFGTLTNVQWLMAPGLAVVVCTASPVSRSARLNQLIFCLVAGLTGPFCLFLLPSVAWRWWAYGRGTHTLALCVLLGLAAGVQGWLIATTGTDHAPLGTSLDLVKTVLDRTISQTAIDHPPHMGTDRLQILLVVAAAAGIFVHGRTAFVGLFLFAATLLVSVLLKFSTIDFHVLAGDSNANGDRYFYIPRLVLLWAIISAGLRGPRWTMALATAALLVVALHPRQWRKPDLPPLPWEVEARKVDRGEPARFVINPAASPDDGWTIDIPARPRGGG